MILEAADRVIEDREPNTRMFMLLLTSLRRLIDPSSDAGAVADSYLLRMTSLAGFRPALTACAECGKPDVARFSIQQGGMVCDNCRTGDISEEQAPEVVPGLHQIVDEDRQRDEVGLRGHLECARSQVRGEDRGNRQRSEVQDQRDKSRTPARPAFPRQPSTAISQPGVPKQRTV